MSGLAFFLYALWAAPEAPVVKRNGKEVEPSITFEPKPAPPPTDGAPDKRSPV